MQAARLRLIRELGRYIGCYDRDAADLNGSLYQQISRDLAGAQRLRQVLDKLGGYPEWDEGLVQEVDCYVRLLSEGQRRARLLGKELDAALEDPRWPARSNGP